MGLTSQINHKPVEIAHTYFERLLVGDLAGLGELFAPDVVWHQPGLGDLSGTYRGTDEVFAHLGRFMAISNGTFRIDAVHDVMANADLVAATIEFSAQHGGDTLAMRGVDLMRIDNGRIVEMWLFSSDQPGEDAFWNGAAAAAAADTAG